MREYTLTVQDAWTIYARWLSDPRVQFHPEPRRLDSAFREATGAFASQQASKWIGDCCLLAFARESGATLVTFDKALLGLARKQNYAAIAPGQEQTKPNSLLRCGAFRPRDLRSRLIPIRSRPPRCHGDAAEAKSIPD
jgi:hypothetical protein